MSGIRPDEIAAADQAEAAARAAGALLVQPLTTEPVRDCAVTGCSQVAAWIIRALSTGTDLASVACDRHTAICALHLTHLRRPPS